MEYMDVPLAVLTSPQPLAAVLVGGKTEKEGLGGTPKARIADDLPAALQQAAARPGVRTFHNQNF